MSTEGTRRRLVPRLRNLLRRTVSILCLGVVGAIVYGYVIGLPHKAREGLLARVSRGAFAIEASSVRFHKLGLRFGGARVYRKGVVGAPALEAKKIYVEFSPLLHYAGYTGVSRVRFNEGVCRPRQFAGEREARTSTSWSEHRPSRFVVQVRDCTVHGIHLPEASAEVNVENGCIVVDRIEGALTRGDLSGSAKLKVTVDPQAGVVRGEVSTWLHPHILDPVLRAYRLTFLETLSSRFDFEGDTPRCDFRFEKQLSRKGDFHLAGAIRIRDGSYRGIEVLRADTDLEVQVSASNSVVSLGDMYIRRPEGQSRGTITIYPYRRCVSFDAEVCIEPVALASMIGVGVDFLERIVRVEGAASAVGRGTVDYGDFSGMGFEAVVEAKRIQLGRIVADDVTCGIAMHGRTNTISHIAATCHGGKIDGFFETVCRPRGATNGPIPFQTRVVSENVDFRTFMGQALQRDTSDYKGRLDADVLLNGTFADGEIWPHMNGQGRLAIKDGRVFMLPVFGGLSRLMTRIIPGLDFVLRQSDVKADFTIKQGVIHSDKLLVQGDVLSLSAHGDYTLPRSMDFDVQVRLLKEHTLVAKLIRLVTYPISKLFEFRVKGTLSDPTWYPVNFSTDLLELVGLKKDSHGARPATPPAEDDSE